MSQEPFRWLAAVIAAHPKHTVYGRTRLQKTVKLLQRLGLPTDYSYSMNFYGPYSEDVQSDIRLLERIGLVAEEQKEMDAAQLYVICAEEAAILQEVEQFQPYINTMDRADPIVLELAATYDAFRERGLSHEESLDRLRQKKGEKVNGGREQAALELLSTLGLPVA